MFINAVKSQKNQDFRENKEAGNIIFYILLFVVLFAALGFAVSQGNRTGSSQISKEQANLKATEILDYANLLKRSVQELQINGCSDTDISFENNIVAGYANADAPTDNSCHVFHPNGGGINYQKLSVDNFENAYNGQADFQNMIFTGNIAIQNIGTAARDLVVIIPYIQAAICQEINRKMNVGSAIPIDIYTGTEFTGSYSASANPIIGDDDVSLENQSIFCAKRQASTWHYFAQVLIAR